MVRYHTYWQSHHITMYLQNGHENAHHFLPPFSI